MTKSKTKRPKAKPIIIPSGAEFSIYAQDSPYGTHGPIRYYGKGEVMSSKEQWWHVIVTVKVYEGDLPHDITCVVIPKSKCRISQLGDLINESLNEEIQEIYDDMEKRGITQDILKFGSGKAECRILTK